MSDAIATTSAGASSGRLRADVAVIGAGPAGIAAAVRAADAGASVVVLDEGMRPGGQIWHHRTRAGLPRLARDWLDALDRSAATVVCGASVVDIEPGFRLAAEVRGAPLTVDAGTVILATGARERFLPFPGWTLPGVVGVGGAQALLKSGASFAGKRIVIAGSGPLLLPVAASLARAGARIAIVAEQAPAAAVRRFGAGLWRTPGKIAQAARYRAAFRATRYAWGTWATRAAGDDAVREVTLTDGRHTWVEPCDVLCTGYGLVPSTELARLAGCAIDRGRVVVDARQRTSIPGIYCAGEPTGIAGVEASLIEGEIAGLAAVGRARKAIERLDAARRRQRRFADRLDAAFAPRAELRSLAAADTIICRCEDVTAGRLRPEWSQRQAKLYTRAGMGPCQGRICGAALEHLFGWDAGTVRAPAVATRLATLIAEPTPDDAGDCPTQNRTKGAS
ncbi:MAG TPA: FAD-dependent oxidoreductase [Longimicrobiales bacterium]